MKHVDSKSQETRYGWPEFPYLVSFNASRSLSHREGFSPYDIEINLANPPSVGADQLAIRFTCVIDLKINLIDHQSCLIVEVEDIKSDQIEGVSYRVVERECGAFSFLCRDFVVT